MADLLPPPSPSPLPSSFPSTASSPSPSSSSSSSSSSSVSDSISSSSSSSSTSSSSAWSRSSADSREPHSRKRRRRSTGRHRISKKRSRKRVDKLRHGGFTQSRHKRGKLCMHKRKRHHGSESTSENGSSRKKRKSSKLHKKREKLMASSAENRGELTKRTDYDDEMHRQKGSNSSLQVILDVQEQQKALIRHNAEIAKAKLASGELQRARDEQVKMQNLYGSVDWRLKKKLRTEKRLLERSVAAGNKLAKLEERETARMDAFRVALGLPTAEAQRQAEWRAQATQSLNDLESNLKVSITHTSTNQPNNLKSKFIGPSLPR